MELQIEKAAALFRCSRCLRDDEIFEMFLLSGMERRLAARLVELLPMAYCRIVLGCRGVRFADTYRRILPSGGISEERELSSEPVWGAVVAHAEKEVQAGIAESEILVIAVHSAEYKAATELLQKGSNLEDIVFTPAIFKWQEDGPLLEGPSNLAERKWWPFGSA
jgi:hypothetical protein